MASDDAREFDLPQTCELWIAPSSVQPVPPILNYEIGRKVTLITEIALAAMLGCKLSAGILKAPDAQDGEGSKPACLPRR
jgi:hypothetical protein